MLRKCRVRVFKNPDGFNAFHVAVCGHVAVKVKLNNENEAVDNTGAAIQSSENLV